MYNIAEVVQVFAAASRPDKATSEFLASLHPDVFEDIGGSDVFDVDIANPTVGGVFSKLIGLAAAAYNSLSQIPCDTPDHDSYKVTLQHASCDVRTANGHMMVFSPFMWGMNSTGALDELWADVAEALEECSEDDPCSSKGSA